MLLCVFNNESNSYVTVAFVQSKKQDGHHRLKDISM